MNGKLHSMLQMIQRNRRLKQNQPKSNRSNILIHDKLLFMIIVLLKPILFTHRISDEVLCADFDEWDIPFDVPNDVEKPKPSLKPTSPVKPK